MPKEKKRKTLMPKFLEETWMRSILTVFSVLLMIGGPTFLMYILRRLGVPPPIFILVGLGSFTFGILFFVRLTKEESK